MPEPKENLRQILCPDILLNKAISILEKLVELDKKGSANWHHQSSIIEAGDDTAKEFLMRMCNESLINGPGYVGNNAPIYCINEKGKKLYYNILSY